MCEKYARIECNRNEISIYVQFESSFYTTNEELGSFTLRTRSFPFILYLRTNLMCMQKKLNRILLSDDFQIGFRLRRSGQIEFRIIFPYPRSGIG